MPTTRKTRITGKHVAELLASSTAALVDNGGTIEVWPALHPDSLDDPELIVLVDHDEVSDLFIVECDEAALEVGRKVSRASVLARTAAAVTALLAELDEQAARPIPFALAAVAA